MNNAQKYLPWFLTTFLLMIAVYAALGMLRYEQRLTQLLPVLLLGPMTLFLLYRKTRVDDQPPTLFWAMGACWILLLIGATMLSEMHHAG